MSIRISISEDAARSLLAIVHGAIDDAADDDEEVQRLAEIEAATREALRLERQTRARS